MKIVNYINYDNIIVKFNNGYTIKSAYKEFKNKHIRSPYDKSVYGIGYIGEGKYKVSEKSNVTKIYYAWEGMLERCYSCKYQNKYPTYKDCTVAEKWLNFQNFGQWYENNYYQIEDEAMCLDKDILHKGNKIYSPETCIFVPETINLLFTKTNAKRGNCPIGVYEHKDGGFVSQCNVGKKVQKYLGLYKTSKEGFQVYKDFKESYIKKIADTYKDKIPLDLYNALYRYEVEIND